MAHAAPAGVRASSWCNRAGVVDRWLYVNQYAGADSNEAARQQFAAKGTAGLFLSHASRDQIA